ncbi:MAG: hypothetical protein N4A50_09055 [Vallitalea sp.]|jgi:hypothetical protein|nr:hypothetical protein [Vallitalea sp.]
MLIDNYEVNSYIVNLSTDEKIPFHELPQDELRKIQEKLINQIVTDIGYEIKSMKINK